MRERRHALRTDGATALPQRVGNVLLHELVTRAPALAARLSGTTRTEQTFNFVGEGFDAAVVRQPDGDVVTKVHYRSAANTHNQQLVEAAQRQAQFDAMAAELGQLVIPQDSAVTPHPLYPSISVVTTQQPFVPHRVADIWTPTVSASVEKVAALVDEVPGADKSLTRLVEGSYRLYDEYGLVPDAGGDNLVVANADQQLLLIDGQPLTPEYPKAQADMLRGIDSLAAALDVIQV
jgi:hypothetical protein